MRYLAFTALTWALISMAAYAQVDVYEPDNDPLISTPVRVAFTNPPAKAKTNENAPHTIEPVGDTDWFVFHIFQNCTGFECGTISVTLTEISAADDITVQMFNDAVQPLGNAFPTVSGKFSYIYNTSAQSATFYVHVRGINNQTHGAGTAYHLDVSLGSKSISSALPIQGTVYSDAKMHGVAGVEVIMDERRSSKQITATNQYGAYYFGAQEEGPHEITVNKLGYVSQRSYVTIGNPFGTYPGNDGVQDFILETSSSLTFDGDEEILLNADGPPIDLTVNVSEIRGSEWLIKMVPDTWLHDVSQMLTRKVTQKVSLEPDANNALGSLPREAWVYVTEPGGTVRDAVHIVQDGNCTPPDVMGVNAEALEDDTVAISWTAAGDLAATYNVYKALAAAPRFAETGPPIAEFLTGTSYTDDCSSGGGGGCSGGDKTEYRYYVTCNNSCGEGVRLLLSSDTAETSCEEKQMGFAYLGISGMLLWAISACGYDKKHRGGSHFAGRVLNIPFTLLLGGLLCGAFTAKAQAMPDVPTVSGGSASLQGDCARLRMESEYPGEAATRAWAEISLVTADDAPACPAAGAVELEEAGDGVWIGGYCGLDPEADYTVFYTLQNTAGELSATYASPVEKEDVEDIYEPDNTPALANVITLQYDSPLLKQLPDAKPHNIEPAGDVDWVRIHVVRNCNSTPDRCAFLTVIDQAFGSEGDFKLQVFDEIGEPVSVERRTNPATREARVTFPFSGEDRRFYASVSHMDPLMRGPGTEHRIRGVIAAHSPAFAQGIGGTVFDGDATPRRGLGDAVLELDSFHHATTDANGDYFFAGGFSGEHTLRVTKDTYGDQERNFSITVDFSDKDFVMHKTDFISLELEAEPLGAAEQRIGLNLTVSGTLDQGWRLQPNGDWLVADPTEGAASETLLLHLLENNGPEREALLVASAVGNEAMRDTLSVVQPGNCPLSKVSAVTALANADGGIDISWPAITFGNPVTYNVYRTLGGSGFEESIFQDITQTSVSDCNTVSGDQSGCHPAAGPLYQYRVTCRSLCGNIPSETRGTVSNLVASTSNCGAKQYNADTSQIFQMLLCVGILLCISWQAKPGLGAPNSHRHSRSGR